MYNTYKVTIVHINIAGDKERNMSSKQYPEYVVLPDIAFQNDIKYLVVRVLNRNEEGIITSYEEVDRSRDSDEADRIADQWNASSKKA
jgi:hypothetical protein